MTTEHPITPSPGLIDKWRQEYTTNYSLARQAARWGADQELEACVEWLPSDLTINGKSLRDARRPKPLSLKEQALELVDRIEKAESVWYMHELDTIRRALKRLQELEQQENNDN